MHQQTLKNEIRASLVLAGPLILAQLAQTSLGFVDTLMVGRLGTLPLASVGLGSTVFFPLFLIGMGCIAAVSPMVSQAFGAGEIEPIGRAARQGLWLALLLALPIMVFLWNAGSFLLWIGQDEVLVNVAVQYLRPMLWGMPAGLGLSALRSTLEGLSRPRPVMMIAFLGTFVNMGANYVLMFGKFGFPALGVAGTGWATTIVYWCMFLAAVWYIKSKASLQPYGIFDRLGRPDLPYFRELWRIGWPIAVTFGIEVLLFAATGQMMGLLGPNLLAGHQIALQCSAFTFMISVGVALATTVRVGQAVGRKDRVGARRAGYIGMGLSVAFMTLTAISFWVLPRPIVGLYLDLADPANTEVAALAISLLWVAGFFQVFDGIQVTASGALRGLKDTRMPMVISFISYWLVGGAIGVYLGFYAGWEGEGLWWGLVAGLATASILMTWRFNRLIQ